MIFWIQFCSGLVMVGDGKTQLPTKAGTQVLEERRTVIVHPQQPAGEDGVVRIPHMVGRTFSSKSP